MIISSVPYDVSGVGTEIQSPSRADFAACSTSVRRFVDLAVWNDRIEAARSVAVDRESHLNRPVRDASIGHQNQLSGTAADSRVPAESLHIWNSEPRPSGGETG